MAGTKVPLSAYRSFNVLYSNGHCTCDSQFCRHSLKFTIKMDVLDSIRSVTTLHLQDSSRRSTCPKPQRSLPKLPSRNSLSPFVKIVSYLSPPLTWVRYADASDLGASVRDNYESKKVEYETEIAGLLGFPVKINIDVNAVWAYAQDMGASQAGSTFTGSARFLYEAYAY